MTGILKVDQILNNSGQGGVSGVFNLNPAFTCREASTSNLAPDGWRSLTWTEELDTNNAVSNGIFTVPAGMGGIYLFHQGVTINGIGASTFIITGLSINGSMDNQHEVYNPTMITNQSVRNTTVGNLNAGDTVEFKVYHPANGGGNRDTGFAQNRKAFFAGFRLAG